MHSVGTYLPFHLRAFKTPVIQCHFSHRKIIYPQCYFNNPFTVDLFACVKSTLWFKDNEFSRRGPAVWLKLWWDIYCIYRCSFAFKGTLTHRRTHRKGGPQRAREHTHSERHKNVLNVHVTGPVFMAAFLCPFWTFFAISRIVSQATTEKTHYITFTLLTAELVCVWVCVCAYEDTCNRKKKKRKEKF